MDGYGLQQIIIEEELKKRVIKEALGYFVLSFKLVTDERGFILIAICY